MTQPYSCGIWLQHAFTNNPPLLPPLIVILQSRQSYCRQLCYILCVWLSQANIWSVSLYKMIFGLIPRAIFLLHFSTISFPDRKLLFHMIKTVLFPVIEKTIFSEILFPFSMKEILPIFCKSELSIYPW